MNFSQDETSAPSSFTLYRSILLKLSGEFFAPEGQSGIWEESCLELARQIAALHALGIKIGIVAGAGNLWRGFRGEGKKFERTASDHMGMLATMMNAIALVQALKRQNIPTRVLNHLGDHPLSERFNAQRMEQSLTRNEVLLFAGGTGHPHFTTDTAAALMALEMNAEVLLKATKVDGVYDKDPVKFEEAQHLPHLTFDQALGHRVEVLDSTALILCRENRLPIRIFRYGDRDSLSRAVSDQHFGSTIFDP